MIDHVNGRDEWTHESASDTQSDMNSCPKSCPRPFISGEWEESYPYILASFSPGHFQ